MQAGAAIFPILLRRRLLLLFAALCALPGTSSITVAQSRLSSGSQSAPLADAAPAQPVYDVVSIKPHKSLDFSSWFDSNDQSYIATNVSLKTLLADAYGIRRDLISGVPKWADDARFDVQAKVVDPDMAALKQLPRAQQRAMLAAVLTDRFHIKVHAETKILSVYDLVATKSGPKFKEVIPQNPASGSANMPPTGGTSIHGNGQLTELTATAVPIYSLADSLGQQLKRTVIDKTNLPGKYDLSLKWTPDQLATSSTYNAGSADTGTSIFTALQEQLGLKLIAAKGPVVTLVVDQAEPPTAN